MRSDRVYSRLIWCACRSCYCFSKWATLICYSAWHKGEATLHATSASHVVEIDIATFSTSQRPTCSQQSFGDKWRECFAGIVIIPAGTSHRAKLRPRAALSQQARLLLPRPSRAVWRCDWLWFTVDQSRDHQRLYDTASGKRYGINLLDVRTTGAQHVRDTSWSKHKALIDVVAVSETLILLLYMHEYSQEKISFPMPDGGFTTSATSVSEITGRN
jgi:hypothetical protein